MQRYLRASDLNYAIVRPGSLTEDAGTGRVQVAKRLEEYGDIPCEEVVAALLATLDATNTTKLTYDVLAGETSVEHAHSEL